MKLHRLMPLVPFVGLVLMILILQQMQTGITAIVGTSKLPPPPELAELQELSHLTIRHLVSVWIFMAVISIGLCIKFNAVEKNATPSAKRILLVEDDLLMSDFLSEMLQTRGYEVVKALNGVEALKVLGSEDFDTILTDVTLPEINGLELLDRVVAKKAHPPVFVISGHDYSESEIKGRGATGFFMKPFRRRDILAAIDGQFAGQFVGQPAQN